MLSPEEMREIADFIDKANALVDEMIKSKRIEIHFDRSETGTYEVTLRDGTPLGRIAMVTTEYYEFIPGRQHEQAQ